MHYASPALAGLRCGTHLRTSRLHHESFQKASDLTDIL